MQNRVHEEVNTVAWTNGTGSAVASGELVDLVNLVGIAQDDIAIAASGVLHTKGIFTVPKDTNLIISQFDRVYVDTANAWLDKTEEDQTYAGIAWAAATQTATTVQVAINFAAKVEINATP